ncbi:MAG TPA: NHL repeat-containing protein [Pirellulales bacterium]|nr:NHL repeat-containing protein [Pirellulales bacterium]
MTRLLTVLFRRVLLVSAFSFPLLELATARAADLQYPLAIAVHGDTVYLADRNLPGVWKSAGGKLSVYFQASKQFRTPLNAPRCLAVDGEGRLYVGDSATREVYRFTADGKPEPLTDGTIGIPMGIAVTADGDLLVSDLEVHRIWKVTLSGEKPHTEKYADVAAPSGICLDADGRLWVVSRGTDALLRVDAKKKVEVVVPGRAFEFPHAVMIDGEGTAFVSDGYAKAVWKVPREGKPEKWAAGGPLVNPVGLAWQDDKLLVADPRAKAVFQIDREGKISAFDLGQGE